MQTFDWVTNENATDNTIKLKEAYWLYLKIAFWELIFLGLHQLEDDHQLMVYQ